MLYTLGVQPDRPESYAALRGADFGHIVIRYELRSDILEPNLLLCRPDGGYQEQIGDNGLPDGDVLRKAVDDG